MPYLFPNNLVVKPECLWEKDSRDDDHDQAKSLDSMKKQTSVETTELTKIKEIH